MKHRGTAVLTALVLAAGGVVAVPGVRALPSPEVMTHSTADSAPRTTREGLGSLRSLVDPPTPPSLSGRAKPERVAVAPVSADEPAVADGALEAVVESLEDGERLPTDLASKVAVEGDLVRVEVTFEDADAARAAIDAAGGEDLAPVTDEVVAVSVPADEVAELEASGAISEVALPAFAAPPPPQIAVPSAAGAHGGDVYDKTQIARWHELGLTGAGVSVGIIDYFRKSSWDDARSHGEVPAAAGTFCRWGGSGCRATDTPASADSGAHGVAVAEAIHDMAPGAKLYLVTVATNEDLRAAIDYLASKKVTIISRSLGGFYDGPGDGTGTSAKLVDYAVSRGMAWFNAAGNAGTYLVQTDDGSRVAVGGYWRGQWRDTNRNRWMEFGHPVRSADGSLVRDASGKTVYEYYESLTIACSDSFRLRWNDWGVSDPTDYDIYRFREDGSVIGRYNVAQRKGVAPLEMRNGSAAHLGCTEGTFVEVGIFKARNGSGSGKDVLELAGNSGDVFYAPVAAGSAGEAFIDSRNTGMAAVGAVDPVAGTTIAGYSSRGPTNDGRLNPKLSAGSNFTSRAYVYEGLGGRFNGTSAATPIVAGAAAVVQERFDTKTPAQVVEYLRTTQTVDRGTVGPDNTYGTGELVMRQLSVARFTATPAPRISGSPTVGATLTASTAWTPAARSADYQWYRDDAAIPGATRSTYTLTSADDTHRIRVVVTGSRPGFTSATVASGSSRAVTKPFATAPAPRISGRLAVGRTLTATSGSWSPKPASLTYRWYSDGKAIRGATGRTYVVRSSTVGTRLSVSVTAAAPGYTGATRTSARTAVVVRTFPKAPAPKISGTAQVGKRLTASVGTWSPRPTRYTYRWKADGRTIPGARGKTYTVSSRYAGKRLTVTVTATKAGYTATSKTSARTATVTKR